MRTDQSHRLNNRSKSRRAPVFIWGLLAGVLWFGAGALAEETVDPGEMLEIEHALSLEFETPHTRWAKPYAEGPVRALFFATWFQGTTQPREIIEFLQRFDLDADAAYYLKSSKRMLGNGNPRWFGDPKAGTNRILRLMETPYDVYCLIRTSFDVLPEEVKTAVNRAVVEGAGLLLIGDDLAPPFPTATSAAPPDGMPGSYFTVGKGRCALLPRRQTLEYAVGWETTLDYQIQGQGRALLWAAGGFPRLELSVRVTNESLARAQLPVEAVQVDWGKPARRTKLRVEIRRWDGQRIPLGVLRASRARTARLTLPKLRAGDYHIDVLAESGRGVENWATAPFRVTSTRAVGRVELQRDWAEVGESFTGKAHCEGGFQPGDRLRARLVDTNDRILAQQDFQAAAVVPFTFAVAPWMPMLLRVEAVLMDHGHEVASSYEFLRVTKRHHDRFNFVVWNFPSEDLAPYSLQSMARYGTTAILQGGKPPIALSAAGLSWVPYTTWIGKSTHTITRMLDPTSGVMRDGCFHDDKAMSEYVRSVVERQGAAREHGVLAYSLGDEIAVRASCLSEHCLRAYREYLEASYADIDALNESWGTRYRSFGTIELLEDAPLPAANAPKWFREYFAQRFQKNLTDNEYKDETRSEKEAQIRLGDRNDEMRALQAENYARWYDRQAFQSYTFVELCKRFKRAFQELDPKALTGFEGTDCFTIRRLTTRSRQGGDVDLFVRELDYFGPYHGPANELVRSIMPEHYFPSGNWIGYAMDVDTLLERYWGQVTNGFNTVQWWRFDNLDGYHGVQSPDLTVFPATRELLDDTRVVRDGLGDLLMQYAFQDDGIAMLYSFPSTHIAHFDGNPTYGLYKRDHKIWHRFIHEAGLQFRYVTDRMLRLGEFDADRYKVLILPLSFAIGEKEAQVIREFVRNGGTLIADVRPGTYDDHCKPLETGILDDVFGIRRTGRQDAMGVDRLSVSGEINGQDVALQWGNWHGREIYPMMRIDPTVEVTTGKNLGTADQIHFWSGLKTPLCIVNEFGQGRAILLNFCVYDAPAQGFMEQLLAAAGARPPISLQTRDGKDVSDIEITRWKDGDTELVALLGHYEGEVTVTLPDKRHVYDIKTGASMGDCTEFVCAVRPNRASFFALLPAATSPELTLASPTAARGTVVNARIRIVGADGKHVVRIEATTPSGERAQWLERSRVVGVRRESTPLPFAHNDPVGEWTIRATDLLTHAVATTTITVE